MTNNQKGCAVISLTCGLVALLYGVSGDMTIAAINILMSSILLAFSLKRNDRKQDLKSEVQKNAFSLRRSLGRFHVSKEFAWALWPTSITKIAISDLTTFKFKAGLNFMNLDYLQSLGCYSLILYFFWMVFYILFKERNLTVPTKPSETEVVSSQ